MKFDPYKHAPQNELCLYNAPHNMLIWKRRLSRGKQV